MAWVLGRLFIAALLLAVGCHSQLDVRTRVDCYPEPGASQSACQARGCLWTEAPSDAPTGTPWCYYPRETGYTKTSQTGSGNNLNIQLAAGSSNPYGSNISPLQFKSSMLGSTLLVTIGNDDRYVPPVGLPMNPSTSTESLSLSIGTIPTSNIFSFKITRDSSKTVIFDTNIGGMQFADQFIQIATYLPSINLFGFGDHIHQRLRHDLSRYTIWPMFARDIGPDSASPLSTQNLYGTQPFYIVVENDGKAHGVLILNSNAQEVETGPGPHLVYRTIGGRLDLAFFPGPKPEDVVNQYLAYIGTPFLPAYWALGYQLCRWGYADLDDMKAAIARTQAANIPLDVPYADIDYMSHDEDFTEGDGWTGFPEYAKQLHDAGLHLILIFDPAIEVDYDTFQRALDQKASFIEWDTDAQVPRTIQDQYPMVKNTKVMLGNVWPERNTAFPDFLDLTNNTNDWWANEFVLFHQQLPFDGIWIDMNEPSNFDTDVYKSNAKVSIAATAHLACPIEGSDAFYDMPPYQTFAAYHNPGEYLCSKTLCMLGRTASRTQRFYDTKNLYGWSESRATSQALPAVTGKRGAIISRSTFISSGRYAGHWLGDNTARWEDLRTSIIGAMEFNFFGIPYVGSDICGFNGETTEELCLRWHQMGAFHPFSRDHNTIGASPQDPAQWPSVATAARIALSFRYQYLPYLYTLHYKASRNGATVLRPLFFEYPTDSESYEIDYQFMWGEAMMIAPATAPGVSTVHAYFPADIWYSMIPETYGQPVDVGFSDQPAKTTSLTPVFVRGGYILPRQAPNTTTTASRLNPMELLIATGNVISTGELYYDAGDDLIPQNIEYHKRHHWTFTYAPYPVNGNYIITGICEKCDSSVVIPTLDTIEIFGIQDAPNFSSFQLNGVKVNINVQTSSYSAITQIAVISTKSLVNLNTYISNSFTLSWTKA